MKSTATLTGRQVTFPPEEIIVSKTDLRGTITYVNDVFVRVSGYTEQELLGAPHRILRHPAMPRAVFRLLWTTIQQRREIFAYVLNKTKTGDEYWVFAHITPSFSPAGEHIGYHSNRRSPYLDALPAVKALYAQLMEVESRHRAVADAAEAGVRALNDLLESKGVDYDEFVFGLSRETTLDSARK